MQFSVRADVGVSGKTECAIIPLFTGRTQKGITADFDRAHKGQISRLLRQGRAAADLGQCLLLHDVSKGGAQNLLLVGCGERQSFGAAQLAKAAGAAADALSKTGIRNAVMFLGSGTGQSIDACTAARVIVRSVRSSLYRFTEQKSKADPSPKLNRMTLAIDDKEQLDETRRGIRIATAVANGIDLARNLGNRSPNVCTPTHLANVAKAIARDYGKLSVRIVDEEQMQKLGMGALLSVTSGADTPAKLIVMQYKGAADDAPPVALCGKGVTFDTGGVSLKPPPKMDEMKFDMCGAAAVIGTMAAIAELGIALNVVAVVPACENMPGGRATRPGDIVTSMSGQTIEILNTDAEGRLILCDALTYVQEFKPACIVDVATLTGACVIALGSVYAGVFSPDQNLSADLVAAGRRAGDEAWPMPVSDEYGESLRSNFADFANVGSRDGGASIAAQFLSRFTRGTPWAHLDIAGVAWLQGNAKGATGRPVGLLVEYLLDRESK